MQIAIIGTGISGLTCAHVLGRRHDVTLFESDDRPGGHAHTVRVPVDGGELDVDTGFLVYNERTYPGLVRLFRELRVETEPSDMSFSMSDELTGLEYRGTSLSSLFAQRRNAARPEFLRMLVDVGRFHRLGRRLLDEDDGSLDTLEDLLRGGTWSAGFVDWYLVPLGSSIWSADPSSFMQMPAATLVRFFDRHGMLNFGGKPAWRTVTGGSSRYVEAIVAPLRAAGRLRLSSPVDHVLRHLDGVELRCRAAEGWEHFDQVVIATHSDQALEMLGDASPDDKEVLGDIAYQPNRVTLHTDARLMPRERKAWAAWNYHRPAEGRREVTMTYHLNALQGLETSTPVLVTLNRDDEIDPARLLASFDYAHPVLDAVAVAAQARHGEVSGQGGVFFCGAYWGYGFHEDGLQSALRVCEQLGVSW